MKRSLISLLSLLLVLCMLSGAFASCGETPDERETTTGTNAESKTETTESLHDEENPTESSPSSEGVSETNGMSTDESCGTDETDSAGTDEDTSDGSDTSDIENDTDEERVEVTLPEGTRNSATIEYANNLANGVQAYFTNPQRTSFSFENKEMYMEYVLSSAESQQVAALKNVNNGHSYIENTMDVYVRMSDTKNTYYASKSTIPTTANIYRFGYYYYEMRLEEQVFLDHIETSEEKRLNHAQVFRTHDINKENYYVDNKILYVQNNEGATDPFIIFGKTDAGYSFSASEYSFLKIKMKASSACTAGGMVFIIAGNENAFSAKQSVGFTVFPDDEVHEYIIPLHGIEGYEDKLKGIRLDISGPDATYEIHEMYLLGVDVGDAPTDLALNRSFHTYSDKMHQTVQVAATKETNGIDAVGITTSIAKNTVAKLIAVDKEGKQYTDISDVTDWSNISHVAFDIVDAGIFGYILPYDGTGGTIKVTLEGDNYVVIQERIPENGTIIPSRGAFNQEKGYYDSVVPHNANDFYINHRIYTDGNHDFDEFFAEAYNETHPISEKFVNVGNTSTGAFYSGYDAARGIYKFTLEGPSNGFNNPYYKHPNKHYNVNFTIRGEKTDRAIYVMTYTSVGSLECAAILDKDDLMLPIPLEVGKNFSEASGERNIFNINDETYGEVIFPMVVQANVKNEYTVLNLYQRWGNFPLKQLSWIQFHSPYYHLSTGVTETNCILPWYTTKNSKGLNTLPDYRTMSAPFWEKQPQHNSCGVHQWLIYTDAEGNLVTSENTYDEIDSYGPTYADVRMDYLSDDGKIKISYTHTEMPQLDENRTYYEIKYEVLEDVTINDFRNNFQFYSVFPNNNTGYYTKVGYLGTDNKPHYADAVMDTKDESGATVTATPVMYKLGDRCPYFSFFDMDNANPKHQEGYANVAVLIYNSEFVIGGEETDPGFVIWNTTGRKIKLSLDLGDVTLKKGDTFTINAILLPWGSQELDRDYADPNNPDSDAVYYDTVINEATGEMYMDKNVRDVRENSLLNPLKATAVKDAEVIDSVFVPKIKTTNGKTAEFTISGGHDNATVRVYGFNKLTVPKVEILDGNEWKEYKLNSSDNPDEPGYIHYYDGYSVFCDKDGTFSYSFVVTMENGKARTFRISAEEDFKNWPADPIIDESREDHLNVYVDAVEIFDALKDSVWVSEAIVADGEKYVSLFGTGPDALNHNGGKVSEGYINGYLNNSGSVESGHLLVLQYRIPTTNSKAIGKFEFFVSTAEPKATEANKLATTNIEADGNWHIIVIDLSKVTNDSFVKNEFFATDGKYYAKLLRFDFFDQCMEKTDYIDVAFFGIDDNMDDVLNYFIDTEAYIETPKLALIEGTRIIEVDIATGSSTDLTAPLLDTFIHPECKEYTASDLDYAACVDGINGKSISGGANSKILSEKDINENPITLSYNGKTISAYKENCTLFSGPYLVVSGWVVADGGVSKYVFSVDGGKTWADCQGFGLTPSAVSDKHLPNAANRIGKSSDSPFTTADDKTNGLFQGLNANTPKGIAADLSDYDGKTVHVIFAAVPASATDTLCLIAYVTDVKVVAQEETVIKPTYNDYVKEGSGYSISNLEFAGCVDRVNTMTGTPTGSSHANSNSTSTPIIAYNSTPVASADTPNYVSTPGNHLVFSGWAIVRGGIEKYVWSADGGSTWKEFELYNITDISSVANDVMGSSRIQGLGYTFTSEADGSNCMFRGSNSTTLKGLDANLSSYAGSTVDVIFAAVPAIDNDTLCLIAVVTGVQVPAAQ